MKLPAKSASTDVHLSFATHVDGAVEAWRDAEVISIEEQEVIIEVGALMGAAASTLSAREEDARAARKATSRMRARFGVRDVVLDLRVMATSDGVLNGPAQRNREHPIFQQVFLDGSASDITRGKKHKEPDVASRLLDRLGKAPDFPTRAALQADLGGAVDKSATAMAAVQAAEKAQKLATDDERTARLALRNTAQKAYGKLVAAFPGRKAFVESFFPKKTSSPRKARPQESPAPEPVNGAANK